MYIILFKKEIKRRATSSAGQSTSFTPRGSAVRIRSRLPYKNHSQGWFFYCDEGEDGQTPEVRGGQGSVFFNGCIFLISTKFKIRRTNSPTKFILKKLPQN